MSNSIKRIRTIALVGQSGAGKTLLAEALLAQAGAIPAPGSIERGTTVCDYAPLEKQLQHSLKLAVASFDARQNGESFRVHLLDTPGYPDFLGQSLPALAAVETAGVVINAQNGIEMMTSRFMQWAAKRGLDRLVVVNKIDADNVDLEALLERIQQAFGRECLPLNLPAANRSKVSDCFFAPSGDADFSSVEEAHRKLIDQVVEVDEKLMESYLEKGEVTPDELHEPLERALREGHLIPVVFTSAKTGAGVAELLDVIVKLLPNPTEGNPPAYISTPADGTEPSELQPIPDPGRHVLAHVFKIEIDPYIGRLAVFRLHQGRLTPGTQLYVGEGRKPIKPGHLYLLRGKQQTEVSEAVPGDIVAIAKVDEIQFDHILHDSPADAHVHARPLELPTSVFGLAVQPRKRGDEQKVSDVLHRIMAEDPCFRIEHNAHANETVMRGLGEMHLKTVLDKMSVQYKLELDTRPPSIPYRETIAVRAEGHSRHKKQTGGAGQFGEVFLKVEPLPRGTGFEFVDSVKGGAIPNQFIPSVEKGVRSVLDSGFVAGFPIQDVRVIVYDGKSHPVDSKDVAFMSAGRKAFLDALGKARPIVLEPIVNVEITAPDSKMGDIAGELSGHRGQIKGSDTPRAGTVQISAQAP
ncbi:MAG TPA: elongation factor G, partial [Burkholderiales bacterium]|nr:elongation factor G [Burkholderiales bacterium]